MRHQNCTLSLLTLCGLLACPGEALADGYDDGVARARALAAQGQVEAAALAFESVMADYPQDYAVALELGWTLSKAGDAAGAERAYRAAAQRSPGAAEARLGLAWALARQGRCEEAAEQARQHQQARPGDRQAEQATAHCEARRAAGAPAAAPAAGSAAAAPGVIEAPEPPAVTGAVGVGVSRLWFPSHAVKSGASGLSVGGGAQIKGRWLVGGLYRYTSIGTADGVGVDPFSQHEVHLYGGYAVQGAGVTLHFASLSDGSGAVGSSRHAGAQVRVSAAGELYLGAYGSFYDDRTILRLDPSWRVWLGRNLSLVPGVSLQNSGGEWLASGRLTALYERDRRQLWVGAKYGPEDRPAYLPQSVVYGILERVSWGLWAGGRVPLAGPLSLSASYSIDRTERVDVTPEQTGYIHGFSLGLSADF